jgi:hypothetical protein
MMIKTNNMNKEEQKKLLIETMEADEKDGLYKQQTALMELLQWVRATLPMDLDTPRMIEEKIESLMDREKDTIRVAYMNGQEDMKQEFPYHHSSLDYYNKTFIQ